MEFRFNKCGGERKELVMAVADVTGREAIYQKAPSFAYEIGGFTVDKHGTLSCGDLIGADSVNDLLERLAERGFVPEDAPVWEESGEVVPCAEDSPDEDASDDDHAADATPSAVPGDDTLDRLSIEMPQEGFSETALVNLERLVAGKAALIGKALGADGLPIRREEGRLCFPWFPLPASPEETDAYTRFVAALCDMAKRQKRVAAREQEVDSEKYAFRCFLLRLGFIGGEYASARKILLRNLSGNGSFRSGGRRGRDAGAKPAARESERVAEDYALAEALADAELIHGVNTLLERETGEAAL